ncbi:hypothetical protein LEP1GSC124_1646 [Leptospira interrogans serovar Pyrogenes str. 200701872]|uniref:Uncharacterized protein n=1 Tax=Leptospira interrogans serovar Pyrogenes str. 200701872 TaxID=1193029 RepID=M6ZZF7_LEPIR|nr:hypothetical protein LEP1GSC124_1646 [Leptospira interrogans serovar Pyrogenes str. 200701872]
MWEFPRFKIVLDYLCDFSNSSQREFPKGIEFLLILKFVREVVICNSSHIIL